MAKKSRKNKHRGGEVEDNRQDKSFNLHTLKENIEEYNPSNEEMKEIIKKFKEEGERLADGIVGESIYFFTPEEVKKTNELITKLINKANNQNTEEANKQITDCVNVEHAEFKDYVSELIWMDKLFTEDIDYSPKTQHSILKLVRELCPESEKVLIENREKRKNEKIENLSARSNDTGPVDPVAGHVDPVATVAGPIVPAVGPVAGSARSTKKNMGGRRRKSRRRNRRSLSQRKRR
jgi:hypothetical protein